MAGECELVLVVGSRNSSNSNRLVEIARNRGVRAHLIDDVSEMQPSWFAGVETMLLTAGASAPEDLVRAVIDALVERYDATVEEREVVREEMTFELPQSLRRLEQVG